MDGTDKVDTGTQYVDDQDISTQTETNSPIISYDLEMQLGILCNRLLHGSYWFLILEMMFTNKLELRGLARCAKQRENVCRESASSIMSWLMKNMATVRMADIAKPDYGMEKDFTAEYAVRTMVSLDTWLEQGVREVVEKVTGQDMEGLEELLKGMLVKHRDLQFETQAMKNKVFM